MLIWLAVAYAAGLLATVFIGFASMGGDSAIESFAGLLIISLVWPASLPIILAALIGNAVYNRFHKEKD